MKSNFLNQFKFRVMSTAVAFVASLGVGYAKENRLMSNYKKPAASELKKSLSSKQFEVTQNCGTEPAFDNEYWDNKKAGIYVDVVSGEPLFSSLDKYDSGSGWPSFTKPISGTDLVKKDDYKVPGMKRTEIKSKAADSHLGHVFDDGPVAAVGLRYCVNSASLRFVPVDSLQKEGYGQFLGLFGKNPEGEKKMKLQETAVLAGGCFWGMEEIIRSLPGVSETTVGYTGGLTQNPKYEDVKTGKTGHAEAIRVVFDPTQLSYEQLLMTFFRMHDPTTLNRQGNDIGSQYRSAIFFSNSNQKKIAEEVRRKVDQSGKWKKPIVTEIVGAVEFYPAEEFHQKYLKKNPGGYTCHFLRD